jgi:hypothetical protein
MATAVQKDKWAAADKAYAKGVQAYIEWGRALAKIDATQEEIAARYDVFQEDITRAIAVGKDSRFITNGYIPKSQRSLYLLTTLDDKGFAELCKPTTTQADILAYKKRLEPPAPKLIRPEKELTDERLSQLVRERLAQERKPAVHTRPIAPLETWPTIEAAYAACNGKMITKAHVLKIFGVERLELVKYAYAYYAKNHPDKGGSGDVMTFLNQTKDYYDKFNGS